MSLAWKVVPSPNKPSTVHLNKLLGISCPSVSACIAVGNSAPQSLAERWNGTKWTILPTPQLGIESTLYGVSCVSVQDCTAVGNVVNSVSGSVAGSTLVETWNGTAWKVVPSPNKGPSSVLNTLTSVSCVSAQVCTAVGSVETSPHDTSKTLIESWNGTAWKIVPSPQFPPRTFNALLGVSCVSVQDCIAVGIQDGGDKPLTESWNGTAWKVVPGPTGPSATGDLNGVTCLSAIDCTAVGSLIGPVRNESTLIESWNGTAWKVVPSPNKGPTSAFNNLNSVSCVSARDCTAVGYVSPDAPTGATTLIESWNSTAWKVVPSPNKGSASTNNILNGVSCASPATCIAVGDHGPQHRSKTLTELGTPAT
jgi:hypothetical protein